MFFIASAIVMRAWRASPSAALRTHTLPHKLVLGLTVGLGLGSGEGLA